MQDTLRFVRSSIGQTPLILASGRLRMLAALLETDVQDPVTGQEMYDTLLAALANKQEDFEISGNGYTVSLDNTHISIESLFDDAHPGLRVPTELFCSCLKGWVEFLNRKNLLVLSPL